MAELVDVKVDWSKVLNGCNAMIDAATAKELGLTTPELALSCYLAGMQTFHAAQPEADRGTVAAMWREGARHFAAEWAAGEIPITFPAEKTT